MSRLSLDLDTWSLLDADPEADLDLSRTGGEGWMPVPAPGDVYRALIAAGRLADPFVGRNEAAAAWVRDRVWWWRTTFVAPAAPYGDEIELVFDGLDTFATIHLDGEIVGETNNMFRRYAFDIGARLTPGATHTLAIRFDPPSRVVGPGDMPVWSAFTDRVSRSRRNQMRKAQFGWGWDWGPDLPTVGIWKPARIEVRPAARLGDVRFSTRLATPERAEAELQIGVPGADGLRVEIALTDPDGRVVFEDSRPASADDRIAITVDRPRLWWTADLGEPALHALSVRLFDGDRLLDSVDQAVGLRTVGIDQSPDPAEPGTTFFRFVLNGRPIFAKGACWVPSTSFVAEVDAAAYARLIDQSVCANMNMIRVWGGGIYEPDLFYHLCDRRGLLVWQDFMFACAHYPDDAAFAASVRVEAEDQVRRLRNHACLAVWCGNNENQAIHRINDDKNGFASPLGGQALYDELLPAILSDLDPAAPYWPSSPWGGPNPNSMKAGDVHDWTVWHGVPPIPDAEMIGDFRTDPEGMAYTRYAEDTSKFVSEFGIQAAPVMATLERWMDPADLDPASEGFHQRIKDEARKAEAMMATVTGQPTTLQQYVDFTQWTQAEGLTFGIEHFRRRRPSCSGALIWQLNDCWPCVSWSLIDWDGAEKAAYHAVRRAFAPVLASFREVDGEVELWITNDTREPIMAEAVLSLERLSGAVECRETPTVSVAAGSHAVIWRGAAPRGSDRVLRVRSPSGAFEPNRLLSAPIKDLVLPGGEPSAAIRQTGPKTLEVELSAEAYTPFTHLVSDRADVRFSDNYIDLFADDRRTIVVTADAPLTPGDIAVRGWAA